MNETIPLLIFPEEKMSRGEKLTLLLLIVACGANVALWACFIVRILTAFGSHY